MICVNMRKICLSPRVELIGLFILAFAFFISVRAAADVEGSVDFVSGSNQYVSYGDFRGEFSLSEEVEILSLDRTMGIGIVEQIFDSYMVVHIVKLEPGFFVKDADRIRKLQPEKPETLKKVVDKDTIINYVHEKVYLEPYYPLDEKKVKKVKKLPPGQTVESLKAAEAENTVKSSRRRTEAEKKEGLQPEKQQTPSSTQKMDLQEEKPSAVNQKNAQEPPDSSTRTSRRRRMAEKGEIVPPASTNPE